MNIMVFNVAAENRGALSILNDFYEEFKKDTSNNYFIVLSLPDLPTSTNIKILKYPWIKKSWLHRLYFDYFVAGKIVKYHKIDEVFSMQNITIPRIKVTQKIYLHQSLPFVDVRFSLFKDPMLWVYQNLISKLIYRSVRKASEVIVQTEWMKKACLAKIKNVDENKIIVMQPKINITITKEFLDSKESYRTFFYPSNEMAFKNHKTIIEACKILKKENISDYQVIFSLNGNENKHMSILYKECIDLDLPVKFVGSLTREQVFEHYTKSVLIFPSFVETFGLPMLEAKLHNTPIIASDCPFSHEILDDYIKAVFFDPFDAQKLALEMKNLILTGSELSTNLKVIN